MNAAMHAVLHSPQLTNYFIKNLHEKDLNKRKKNASAFVLEYKKLVDAYWERGDVSTAFENAASLFRKIHAKAFPEGAQHDAHEALCHILRTLHDGLSKAKVVEGSKAVAALRGPDLEAWQQHVSNDYSIISEIFQTQTVVDAAYDHGMGVHIPPCDTLIDGFRRLITSETVTCPDGKTIVRTPRIAYLPLVLIVQLQHQKTNFMDYPIELDVTGITGSSKDVYTLFSVIFHSGSLQSGHYTCISKLKNAWYEFDDEKVSVLKNSNAVVRPNAYVLMYKRIFP